MVAAATPSAPRFEHRTAAFPVLGMETGTPRLSWSLGFTGRMLALGTASGRTRVLLTRYAPTHPRDMDMT